MHATRNGLSPEKPLLDPVRPSANNRENDCEKDRVEAGRRLMYDLAVPVNRQNPSYS